MSSLSSELHRYLFDECDSDQIRLVDLMQVIDDKVFGVLFVLLALPSALPVPAPGYSVPFGIVLFLLSVQFVAGSSKPWLPKKLAMHPFKLEKAQGILKAGSPWLKRVESITHPRLTSISKGSIGRVVLGGAIALMSLSMMIIIPGTNTIPAFGIFVIGCSLIEEDGLISLLGLLICGVGLAVTSSIIFVAIWGGSSLLELFKDWLKSILVISPIYFS